MPFHRSPSDRAIHWRRFAGRRRLRGTRVLFLLLCGCCVLPAVSTQAPGADNRSVGNNPWYGREMYRRRYGSAYGPDRRDDYRYQAYGGRVHSGPAKQWSYRPHYTGQGLYRRLYAPQYGRPAGFGWGQFVPGGLWSYAPKYPYGPGHFYGQRNWGWDLGDAWRTGAGYGGRSRWLDNQGDWHGGPVR